MKKLLYLSLLLTVSLAHAQTSDIQFIDGWIKQLPPVIPMRAGYVVIKNTGSQPKTITSLDSDAFDKVEMHQTMMTDGVMKMVQLQQLVIPPSAEVALKPGARHFMLIAPKHSLQIGDKITIVAHFKNGSQQNFTLEVKK